MRNTAIILITALLVAMALAALTAMTGCRTVKQVSSSTVASSVRDTTSRNSDTVRITHNTTKGHDLVQKDTAIGVRGGDVSIVEDADCNNDTTARDGNTSLHMYTDNKGKRHADCKTDSLTIVINNLTRENNWLVDRLDSVIAGTHMTQIDAVTDTTTLRQVVEKENKGWVAGAYEWLKGAFAVIGLLVVAFFIGRLVIKKFTA